MKVHVCPASYVMSCNCNASHFGSTIPVTVAVRHLFIFHFKKKVYGAWCLILFQMSTLGSLLREPKEKENKIVISTKNTNIAINCR